MKQKLVGFGPHEKYKARDDLADYSESLQQGTVGDYVGHHTLLLHCLKHIWSLLWLLAFLAGAD